ncbi:MAG TPA: twin-arginine translocase subunit TatC [Anaerolineales bacterium]|nr:twin-arginine translocase subunit TatC [Anaerolineales bacterium]
MLRNTWRVLTAPIRFVARPFTRLYFALTAEPEDTSAADAFSRTIQDPSLVLEHLEALRGHLLRSVVALAITTAIGFAFASTVLDWLARPIGGIEALQAIEVTESVSAFMRVSLLAGFVLAFPYLCLEVFFFIAPGLKRRERVLVLVIIPTAFVLFLIGLAFAYYVMLPVALPFLLNFMNIETVPRPSNYIRFVTGLMFWIGVAFQFPLVMFTLAAIGLVRARTLLDGWRIAIVLIAVLAAVITPTIDPVNMGLVMAPMIVLYFLSILLAAIAERGRARRAREATA